jgi:hypothetical protein
MNLVNKINKAGKEKMAFNSDDAWQSFPNKRELRRNMLSVLFLFFEYVLK